MTKYIFLFFPLVVLFQLKLHAQTESAIWSSVKGQFDISKKWSISFEPQLRWTDSNLEKRIIETGVDYEPIKYLSVEGIHRFTKESSNSYHRVAIDINGKMDVGRFEPNARLRYTNIKDFNADGGANFLRYRLGTEYDIPKSKLTPEVSAEIFQELIDHSIRKVRYTVSSKYKFNGTHSVSLGYKRDQFLTKRKWVNIVDMNYRISF